MTTPLDTLSEKLRELATGWTSYTAFGSFLLYVVGYLHAALPFDGAWRRHRPWLCLTSAIWFTGAKFVAGVGVPILEGKKVRQQVIATLGRLDLLLQSNTFRIRPAGATAAGWGSFPRQISRTFHGARW
jgi:hypothetical protein